MQRQRDRGWWGEERKAGRDMRLCFYPFTDSLGDRIHQNGPNQLPSYTGKGDDSYLDGSVGWFNKPQGIIGRRSFTTAGPSAQETTASLAVQVQNTYSARGHVAKFSLTLACKDIGCFASCVLYWLMQSCTVSSNRDQVIWQN